jgi:hypothetical protein
LSTHRQIIADRIKADNPDFIVKAFAASAPTALGKGKAQVAVWRESIKPNQNSLESSMTVQILCNSGDSPSFEEDLEGVLDQVILSIERIPGVLWTEAVKGIYDEKYFGYQLTVTLHSPNVYKSIVRQEQEAVTNE